MKYANRLSYEQLCELFGEIQNKIIEIGKDEDRNFYINNLHSCDIEDLIPRFKQDFNTETCLFIGYDIYNHGATEIHEHAADSDVMQVHDMSFSFANIKFSEKFGVLNELEDVFIKFMLKTFGKPWKKDFISYKYQQELEHIGYYTNALKRSIVDFCNNSGDELMDEQGKLCEVLEILNSKDHDKYFVSKKVENVCMNKVIRRVERLESELESEKSKN